VSELKNAGHSAIGVKPEHNKLTRMSIQSAKFESGQVFFPNQAPWLADLEDELFAPATTIRLTALARRSRISRQAATIIRWIG
jgi:phage terminase large subunit-like protein